MSKVYLAVRSTSLTPADISDSLGMAASETVERGERRHPRTRQSQEHRWYLELGATSPAVRIEHLLDRLVLLGDEVAERIGVLVTEGKATTSLEIVQEVNGPDDYAEIGIVFSSHVVAWLCRAKTPIDLDQYFHAPGESRAASELDSPSS